MDSRVRWFTTIEAFDRWRQGGPIERTLQPAIAEALRQIGCLEPPAALKGVLAWLAERRRVPHLKEIADQCSSRRTFFRAWRTMPETPARFLQRVRAIHAKSLLSAGYESSDAASLAGYPSVESMRQRITARREAQG